jgi:uncharacterized protein (UPF0276 family)
MTMTAQTGGGHGRPLDPRPSVLGADAGIGLRAPHYPHFLNPDLAPAVAWLEAHAENYFNQGGVRHQMILAIAERYPISLHGVALSLGSAEGLNPDHLNRLAALVAEINPPLVSEHLAWSRSQGIYYNDLLPLPLTEESLDVVCANVDRVQDRLGRTILIENPSGYLPLGMSALNEADFLARIVARTGCGLLLDVNNLFISAANLGTDVEAWLSAIPSAAIGEIHLAGHAQGGTLERPLLIDTHGAPVAGAVWSLYEDVVRRFGPRPTLIEWDSALPSLETLLGEARLAQAILDRA